MTLGEIIFAALPLVALLIMAAGITWQECKRTLWLLPLLFVLLLAAPFTFWRPGR